MQALLPAPLEASARPTHIYLNATGFQASAATASLRVEISSRSFFHFPCWAQLRMAGLVLAKISSLWSNNWRATQETPGTGGGPARMMADGFDRTNGLAFSPDYTTLYVGDSGSAQGGPGVRPPHPSPSPLSFPQVILPATP